MSLNWQPNVRTYARWPLSALLALALLQPVSGFAASTDAPPPGPDPLGGTLKSQTPKLAPTAPSDKAPTQAPATSAAQKTAATAPPPAAAVAAKGAKPAAKTAMPPTAPPIEKYAQVASLEKLMFGVAQPNIPIEYRLDRLESEVFHQTNPEWDAQRRISRLNNILLGGALSGAPSAVHDAHGSATPPMEGSASSNSFAGNPAEPGAAASIPAGTDAPYMSPGNPYLPALPTVPTMPLNGAMVSNENQEFLPPPPELNSPEFNKPLSREELEQYALQLVNEMRFRQGFQPLEWDQTGYKLAKSLVSDLCKRNTLSHQDTNGDNPDVRYTKAGGNDCLVESLVSVKTKGNTVVPSKALVYKLMKELVSHQDDRDAMLASHATQFAFTFDMCNSRDRLIGCAETITHQADIDPIPSEVRVGDHIDVKGVMKGPYQFKKITVAWEGPPAPDDSDDQDEAAPYFPPLDYEAFARKSEHDWSKQQRILQIAGIGAALAGGVFIPPVALAAPLIAAAGSSQKPKAISEIPVRGGVHVDGSAFSHKTPLNKDNKEGIYYITVWAESEADGAPFAVSRRAVIARPVSSADTQTTGTADGDNKVLTAHETKREHKRDKNDN